jgi:hypothetical protein
MVVKKRMCWEGFSTGTTAKHNLGTSGGDKAAVQAYVDNGTIEGPNAWKERTTGC